MSNVSLAANSNVTIRCIDKYGKVIRTSHIHNKATYVMVEGLLRYLKGDFTPSQYNLRSYDGSEAVGYLPAEVRFGNIGVDIRDRGSETPYLEGIDSSAFIKPTFSASRLQQGLQVTNPDYQSTWDRATPKFESADITTFDDPSNSMSLLLQAFIPSGQLVVFKNSTEEGVEYNPWTDEYAGSGEGWAYYDQIDNEWKTILTEIGLYAENRLLARVLLDGEITVTHEEDPGEVPVITRVTFNDPNYELNPIIQSQTTSMIVEWRIGITSIGQNDTVSSTANLLTTVTLNPGEGSGTPVVTEYRRVGSFTLPDELPEGWTAPAGKVLSGWERVEDYSGGDTYNFIGEISPMIEFTAIYEEE